MIHDFIKALRASNIRISVAETMEAIETLNHVGLFNRQLLKDSLSLVLAKTRDDKETYSNCFDLFFTMATTETTEIAAQDSLDATPATENKKSHSDELQNEGSSSLLELIEKSDQTALAENHLRRPLYHCHVPRYHSLSSDHQFLNLLSRMMNP